MKGLGSALKVGVVVILVAVVGFSLFKSVSERVTGTDGYRVFALFRDASGLSDKSRVVIAGLTIGEILDRRLEGNLARITIRIRKGVEIWSNAAIVKKSSSLLGDSYLELEPGGPTLPTFDGKPPRLLVEGDQIMTVVESTTPADLMLEARRILPSVNEVLLEVRDLAADTRALMNGPVYTMAETLDETVKQDAELIHSILLRADLIAGDFQRMTGAANQNQVNDVIDTIQRSARELEGLLKATRGEVEGTGESVRATIARLDRSLSSLESTMGSTMNVGKKLEDPEAGTLGRLVNDTTIADNIEAITDDARKFTRGVFGLQMVVGLGADFKLFSQVAREYLSVEIYPRPDKFYLVEFVAEQRGDLKESWIVDGDQLRREETISQDGFRLTIMYGKRIRNWLSLRVGIKESSGGIGADFHLLDDNLRLTTDLFEFGFNRLPRLRIYAAYSFWKYLYLVAGVDDILNNPENIPVAGDNLTGDQLTSLYLGRDVYLGAMLRFTDEDLRTLLFVGGSALAGSGD
jgi:phospholipid/cholesterol/gamma-HCH transport system substrate-binding protein